MAHRHSGCCGCGGHHGQGDEAGSGIGMPRRTFLAAVGGSAVGSTVLAGCATTGAADKHAAADRPRPVLGKKELVVQPVLAYQLFSPRPATSWRPWGGLANENDINEEVARIDKELEDIGAQAEFPLAFKRVARVSNAADAAALCKEAADVMLIYAASADGGIIETLISPDRHNLMFLRHQSGPVYLWYEIAHPRLLRKTVDVYGQPGLDTQDIIVDKTDDVLWRLRALYALKNTVGSSMIAIGDASGWGVGGQQAPKIAADKWKMDIVAVPYQELEKRIQAAKANADLLKRTEAEANAYMGDSGVSLKTDKGFVTRAFLLTEVFRNLMADAGVQAMTINNCMSTVMPMSETTACLPLSILNDEGYMAFCESDFVVIPSGVLLHHICNTPVFLQDPTYPHHGIITVAHCTAPRRMDGKHNEKVTVLTHFESDYGAAPKVDMRIGQEITMIDPDFASERWIGFSGKIVANPFMAICRSQVDCTIDGDWRLLADEMKGFHWMLAYGNHLKELGYALHKVGIGWLDISAEKTWQA